MKTGQHSIGQSTEVRKIQQNAKHVHSEDFVLEKSIFSSIFDKDIRRVFIYNKAERLAKAIHLIIPAFANALSLKEKLSTISVGLLDAAMLPPIEARKVLPRELLSLSSILSLARSGNLLSSMNVAIIMSEAQTLLNEVALYEEPRLSPEEAPTLSTIARNAHSQNTQSLQKPSQKAKEVSKGHIKDIQRPNERVKDRQGTILSVITDKGTVSIKDISTLIRGVSEKTIQRELSDLIEKGMIAKKGERRWSTYSLA